MNLSENFYRYTRDYVLYYDENQTVLAHIAFEMETKSNNFQGWSVNFGGHCICFSWYDNHLEQTNTKGKGKTHMNI
jgi:hypothetical protein